MSRDRALYFRGDEREGAAVALAALAGYLRVYSGSVMDYARKLRA